MKLYMGLEGVVSSYSVGVLSDEKGQILSAVKLYEPLSLHTIPKHLLKSRLTRLIQSTLQAADLKLKAVSDVSIVIGLSGATFNYNTTVDVPNLFKEMELSPLKLVCTRDVDITLVSHTRSLDGSVIMCTMGSMIGVSTPSTQERVGGWGPVIGDDGSGYWMGRAVLQAIGEEVDAGESFSHLWQEVHDFLNKPPWKVSSLQEYSIRWQRQCMIVKIAKEDPRTAIFSFAHEVSRKGIAAWRFVASRLVIPLMRAWQIHKDKRAKGIVENAARLLVKQLILAHDRAKVDFDDTTIVLYGGVFTHNQGFTEIVHNRIQEELQREISIITPHYSDAMRPVCGALLLGLGNSDIHHLQLPHESVFEQVLKSSQLYKDLQND